MNFVELNNRIVLDPNEICLMEKHPEFGKYFLTIVFKNGVSRALEFNSEESCNECYRQLKIRL